ncbi:MAG: ParB N-terminal domain-containing protein [Deltaproteobacteria bacterium]|nr:MAG: ParB N-terminal domain-containing protein [Deltaproteobacteria bacterium]
MVKKPLGDIDFSDNLGSDIELIVPNMGRTVEEVPIFQIYLEDDTFQIREPVRLEGLTGSIEAAGQQNPVILRRKSDEKWQILTGFRRIRALRDLKKEVIKACLFDELSDEEAVKLGILDNLYREELSKEEIERYQEKLREKGILNPNIESFLQEKMAIVSYTPTSKKEVEEEEKKAVEEEKVEVEAEVEEEEREEEEEGVIYLEDLISGTREKLTEVAEGLDQLYQYWEEVSSEEREDIIAQCQYIHDLLPFLKNE